MNYLSSIIRQGTLSKIDRNSYKNTLKILKTDYDERLAYDVSILAERGVL